MDNTIYEYHRVWLYREFDIPFTPQAGMSIDIQPYFHPQKIRSVTWDTKKDNELVCWMETKNYGQKDSKKQKKEIEKGETTESQSEFEKAVVVWKSYGWIEEEVEIKNED